MRDNADRLEDTVRMLSRELDRPEPSLPIIRQVAVVGGKVAGALLLAATTGVAGGAAQAWTEAELGAARQTAVSVTEACDAVVAATLWRVDIDLKGDDGARLTQSITVGALEVLVLAPPLTRIYGFDHSVEIENVGRDDASGGRIDSGTHHLTWFGGGRMVPITVHVARVEQQERPDNDPYLDEVR